MLAYHFTGDTLRDGRPIPAIGETLIHSEEIIWCKSGLYASPKPHMALEYAPGSRLHLVSCEDIVREDIDKFVCRRRTILKSFDATDLLRRFAADQALSVKHFWNMPTVVEEYLTTLDNSKRLDAKYAAWAASSAAARAAAWTAANDTASDAASAAAWATSSAAARNAAWAAARNAAWAASSAAARAAAWAAANDAARATARDAANKDFDKRVYEAFTYGEDHV